MLYLDLGVKQNNNEHNTELSKTVKAQELPTPSGRHFNKS